MKGNHEATKRTKASRRRI